jgi:hypothetical protein
VHPVQQVDLLAQRDVQPVARQVDRAQAHHDGAQFVRDLAGKFANVR